MHLNSDLHIRTDRARIDAPAELVKSVVSADELTTPRNENAVAVRGCVDGDCQLLWCTGASL